MRLALLAALSAAADEITEALLDSPGAPAVSVRVDGDDLLVDVRSGNGESVAPPVADDGDATARISLRLSEALKGDIEDAARRDSVSVNSWLVRAANSALTPQWGPGTRFADPRRQHGSGRSGNSQHITGWING
jgi:hypothetical protein